MSNLFCLSDGVLNVGGINLLNEVPRNVCFTSFASICKTSDAPPSLFKQVQTKQHKGGFLGFTKSEQSDRLMNSIGMFHRRRFLSIFRFKAWWSTMCVGNSGSELKMETQWVLFDVPELNAYVIILPLIEGSFRSALHPGKDDHVMIWAESGSSQVKTSSFNAIAYIHMSDNPYDVMKESFKAIRVHLKTFRLLEEKSVSPIVDRFGWCTWDAFYRSVTPVGIWHGVKDFSDAGIRLRFLIIDDGWQCVNFDGDNPVEEADPPISGGRNMSNARLCKFEECEKFRSYKKGSLLDANAAYFDPKQQKKLILKSLEAEQAERALDMASQYGAKDLMDFKAKLDNLVIELGRMNSDHKVPFPENGYYQRNSNNCSENGMKAFIMDLRSRFEGLDDVYVWQALCGGWGGVRPGATNFDTKIIPSKESPGLEKSMRDGAWVNCVKGGIGLVHPNQAADFYETMHSYLANLGITGVKVDVMLTLELVCEDYGGRVELAKAYYKGLSKSLVKNFHGTGLLSSMQQCNDFFFLGTSHISMGRVCDDFWYHDPNGDPEGIFWLQGLHMVHCAYNSMWMGQIIHPDWDMFKSDHQCAKFHAGARAICGGPVYLSDSVGSHDFDLIRKVVFPYGTIPRCQHFALPTRDCLFKNPISDGETVLKIWNINKFGGVIGAFNCQGARWDPKEQRNKGSPECYKPALATIHTNDIEWNQKTEAKEMGEAEEYAVYFNQAKELKLMSRHSHAITCTIQPSSFEIFSFAPVLELSHRIKVAPIGLVNMFNCVGTLVHVACSESTQGVSLQVELKGEGELLLYSSQKPKKCTLNGVEKDFQWSDDGKLTIYIIWEEKRAGRSVLVFAY